MYQSRLKFAWTTLGVVTAVAAVIVIGGMVSLFPVGFMARIVVLLSGVVILGVFAATPSGVYTGWEERAGFTFLMVVVMLLVVWPRFLFLKAGPGPSVNGLTLALFGLLVYTIGALLRRREIRDRFLQNVRASAWFLAFLAIFLAWRFVAVTFTDYWLAATIEILRETVFLLAVVVGALAFTGKEKQEWVLIHVLLVSVAIATVVGVVELKLTHNLFLKFVDLDAASGASVNLRRTVLEKFREGAYRVQSTFDHPIVMGQFFAMMFSVVVATAAASRRFWRVFSLALLPAIVVMVAKSGSRSGLIGLAISASLVAALFVGLHMFRRGSRDAAKMWWFFVALGVATILVVLLANSFADALESILRLDRRSTEARVEFVVRGMPAIQDSPIVGYGYGMAALKAGLTGSDGYLTLDNYFLSLALDFGLPAVVAYAAMHLIALWRARRALAVPGPNGLVMAAFAVAIVVFLAIQTILSIPNNQSIVIVMALVIMQLGDNSRLVSTGEGK